MAECNGRSVDHGFSNKHADRIKTLAKAYNHKSLSCTIALRESEAWANYLTLVRKLERAQQQLHWRFVQLKWGKEWAEGQHSPVGVSSFEPGHFHAA